MEMEEREEEGRRRRETRGNWRKGKKREIEGREELGSVGEERIMEGRGGEGKRWEWR